MPLRELDKQGRRPRFCSAKCKQREYRARKKAPSLLPDSLTSRNSWTRRDGKRPIRTNGYAASSTDPSTWASFSDVQSGAGDGFGVMLGDGLGCFDFDHCLSGDTLTPRIERALAAIREPVVWVERSMSGDGLHVFVEAPEQKGYKRDGIEFYSRARFIAVTGMAFTI